MALRSKHGLLPDHGPFVLSVSDPPVGYQELTGRTDDAVHPCRRTPPRLSELQAAIWISTLCTRAIHLSHWHISIKKPLDAYRTPAGFYLLPTPILFTQLPSVMVSTAIDIEQSSLSQRAVGARTSSEFESEKVELNDGQSSSEENPGEAWQPEDA